MARRCLACRRCCSPAIPRAIPDGSSSRAIRACWSGRYRSPRGDPGAAARSRASLRRRSEGGGCDAPTPVRSCGRRQAHGRRRASGVSRVSAPSCATARATPSNRTGEDRRRNTNAANAMNRTNGGGMHGRISEQDHHLRDGDIRGSAARGAALPCAGARAARARRAPATSSSAARSTPRSKAAPMVGHMYVEYMIPQRRAPSLSDRDGPWRQPDRHQLHRHARRPRGLGAVFRAPRLRRLRGRSGGARPRRATGRRRCTGRCSRRASPSPSSASSRRSVISNGRRRICTRSGRAPASRAIPPSTSSTPRSFPRS